MNTDEAHRFVRATIADKAKPQIAVSVETLEKLTADRDIIQELIGDVRALLAAAFSDQPLGNKNPATEERDTNLIQNLQSDLDDFDRLTLQSSKRGG